MKKKILVCNTGGTIGMKATLRGYLPQAGFLEEQMRRMPELKHAEMPEYELHEFDPLLDSANMRPSNWLTIAQYIESRYAEYSGFVVIHGTDTMAYTSSALSFLLTGLDKPVVLTGSQIPLCEFRNDARENLITSLLVAANSELPEVTICFGGFLLRGCRARKVTANGFDAFQSPNIAPLGTIGTRININKALIRPQSAEPFRLAFSTDSSPQVAAIRLFPGIDREILTNLFRPPLKGIVIEAFGVGNAPSNDEQFLRVIQAAVERDVIIVVCTQCHHGRVDLHEYAAGRALAHAGAISGFDMTAEAALAKLYCLLNQGLTADEVKSRMQSDWVGELSPSAE